MTEQRLPTFMIGGAQKSGTTSLHMYLAAHPDIHFPDFPQEIHFFAHEKLFRRGIDHYARHFTEVLPTQTTIGQTSPLYLYSEEAPIRIAATMPDAKMIFVLRDPVKRAYSHYWHSVKYGFETRSFSEALKLEKERLGRSPFARRHFSYVDRGFYAAQLKHYLDYIPHDQILVLIMEEMVANPLLAINRCCRFLGVHPFGHEILKVMPKTQWNRFRAPKFPWLQRLVSPLRAQPELEANRFVAHLMWKLDQINLVVKPYPKLAAELERHLVEIFGPHQAELAKMFGLDLSRWTSQQSLAKRPEAKRSLNNNQVDRPFGDPSLA